MNNIYKFLLGLLIALIVLFGLIYTYHTNKIESVRVYSENKTEEKEVNLLSEKEILISGESAIFRDQANEIFKIEDASIYKDTVITTFIFQDIVQRKTYDNSYLKCFETELENLKITNSIRDEFKIMTEGIKLKYGASVFEKYFAKINEDVFYESISSSEYCHVFFKNIHYLSVNINAIQEFDDFLRQELNDKRKGEKIYNENLIKSKNKIRSLRNKMTNTGTEMFEQKANPTYYVNKYLENHKFSGKYLGDIVYSISNSQFNDSSLEALADQIFTEQYANYSLATGAKPYSSCFGSSNYCSGSCSEIVVNTPSNSDVLVTIKRRGNVYRHAYINENDSYKFKFPNGEYQIFFYYGKGWNPNKDMNSSNCKKLRGGFLSNELFGKDDSQFLNNQVLTYTLILQENGNFSTRPSSASEAF